MRFLLAFLILLMLLLSLPLSFAETVANQTASPEPEKGVRQISPIATMVRSTVFPGWGQLHSRNYFRGGLILFTITTSTVGAFFAQRSFATHYNNYVLTASIAPEDAETVLGSYDKANQSYKLRMFFIYTALGTWVYSIMDSYVSANFYNATSQIRSIQEDAQQIEKLGLQVGVTPSRLYLGVVKAF